MMTEEEQKCAIAEWMGFVWYRAPQDRHFPDKKYRFLALPEIQEYEGQIDIWKQRADGTEKIIESEAWKKAQGVDYVPNYPLDLNAMREAKNKLPPEQRRVFGEHLCKIIQSPHGYGFILYIKHPFSGEDVFSISNASSEQESESLCRTLWPDKWAD